jgi:uncharacterized protein YciI
MPYFALLYDTVENFAQKRLPFRGAHLALVDDAHRRGEVVMAGALQPSGALLIFRAAERGVVEQFARTDPYVTSGVVSGWRVHEWTVVVGEGAAAR